MVKQWLTFRADVRLKADELRLLAESSSSFSERQRPPSRHYAGKNREAGTRSTTHPGSIIRNLVIAGVFRELKLI